MAGSYRHCVDDSGNLRSNEDLVGMLENGGDVYEAAEMMVWMIKHLAGGSEERIKEAEAAYYQACRAART